ncbi:PAAR domain-containing protein [Neisseriaceae bacterium TC5R-5]|nr:PAAR domain-containing protein [Neisseriaceae bacterium TC5R-5]
MRNSSGKGVIRLGDGSSHGGQVITALEQCSAGGVPVAAEGCLVRCPQCKGEFAIVAGASGKRHHGKALAYEGDVTTCGAVLLSSL